MNLFFGATQYFEAILVNGVSGAFVIPHYSSKTCIIAAVTMTSHLNGYTSVDVKTQLVFYTFAAASFRLLNLADPYSALENFGSKIAFGSSSTNLEPVTTNGNKKVIWFSPHLDMCLVLTTNLDLDMYQVLTTNLDLDMYLVLTTTQREIQLEGIWILIS